MHHMRILVALLLAVLTVSSKSYSQEEFPILQGPYFGQKRPGLTPEIFAPGIVSINEKYVGGISFSRDLNEMYFSAEKKDEDSEIFFSKIEGGKWSPIKKANFTKGKKAGEMQPFISFNDKKIYFTAYNSDLTDTRVWSVSRSGNSWSDAVKLDSPINDDQVFYANQAKNGDIFYTNISDLSNIKMNYAPNKNDKFTEIKEVDIEFGIHGFIASSQDFLVVNARNKEGGKRRDNDIYVYFKEKNGTWSKPVNLGNAVNSSFSETSPSITLDGKYLFFSRTNEEKGLSNLYWVSTEIIHKLKTTYFKINNI